MKFTYPAIIRKTEKGNYYGFCPDLQDCQAEGDTVQEAADNLQENATGWIELELSEGFADLPPISEDEDLAKIMQPGDIRRNVACTIRLFVGYDE